METIQLPKNNYLKTFSFYYAEYLYDTFIISEDCVHHFFVDSDVVDIRSIDLDLFYAYMYFRIFYFRGNKNIHNHTPNKFNSTEHHKKYCTKIMREIDKVKDNMPIKKRKYQTLSKEVY